MGLAGELSTIGLAEVFQNLAFNHHTGTLTLVDGKKKARICFEEGKIRAVRAADDAFDFVAIAAHAAAAPEESLAKARQASNRRRTLRAFLRAAGPFDEDAYDAMVAGYVQEAILPLFGWTRASFSFEKDKMNERVFGRELLDCGVQLDALGVAMEAARRHDEWETIEPYVPKEDQVLVLAGGMPPGEPTVEERRVLELIDGTRNLGEVVEAAPLKKFDVFKTVATLVERGTLMPATPERLTELAGQAQTAGRVTLAAKRLEMALRLDNGDLDARRELVRLHERAGRKLDAAAELVKVAVLQNERGDVQGALESYERAGVLAPKDLDVLERIFEMHDSLGNTVQAVKAGRRLAESLVAADMPEDALPLYERLLRNNERNAALRESLAQCLLLNGDAKGAAQHVIVVADRMYDQGEFDVALKYYRRILAIDGANEHAKERAAEIDSGAARARLRFRKRRRAMVLLGVALGAALLQGAREWFAQGALHTAQHASVGALSRDNADDARVDAVSRYVDVTTAYPFTRGAVQARETIETLLLAEVERLNEALRRAQRAQTTAELEYSLLRGKKLLARLDELDYDETTRANWEASRDDLRTTIAALEAVTSD
jgi:tetratricopeptide (TPR) repeat protein